MRRLHRVLILCAAALGLAQPGRLSAQEAQTTQPVAAAPAGVAPDTIVDTAVQAPVDAVAPVAIATTLAPALSVSAAGAGFAEAERLVVHKSQRRLELIRNGAVVAEYAIRLGLNPAGHKLREGDFRTPEGHYYLSRRNPRSEFFLSIGVSYPNDADRRRARGNGKKPGGSIMIHGLPNVPRKPADYYAHNDWTDGCIAVSNSDMVDIWLRTKVGLPIEIRP
jgi:hypothetical protein